MDDMTHCSSCGAELRPGARFCDKCGAEQVETPAQTDSAATTPKRKVNWTGLLMVAAVLVVIWLLVSQFGNRPDDTADPANMGSGTGANPHASMGSGGDSSQGGMGAMGATGANPHGTGKAEGEQEEDHASYDEAKAALEADPLDLSSLAYLYRDFGMIGRMMEIRPYLDAALLELAAKEAELGDDLLPQGERLAEAVLSGSDFDGVILVYEKLNELRPEYYVAMKNIGDIHAQMGNAPASEDYYVRYIEHATPADGDPYWNARINLAILKVVGPGAEGETDPALVEEGIGQLEIIAEENPEFYQSWASLGFAYETVGDTELAVAAWQEAAKATADETLAAQATAKAEKLATGGPESK